MMNSGSLETNMGMGNQYSGNTTKYTVNQKENLLLQEKNRID